mmetsp:Transcript_38858/g.44233  ORF Transcript_38858/g.44233 Transcript_38858/m.44233 type:complete len:250 (+) Transcript_38858:74-823(+)
MSGAGSGFDLTPTTFNSEGKLFQVEYSAKAVDGGNTVVGLNCSDGVLLATEKVVLSKMMVDGTNKKTFSINKSSGAVICGNTPDGRHLVGRGREEAKSYLQNFGVEIHGDILADRVAQYMHLHTCYSGLRPFGAGLVVATHDKRGYHLHSLDNSGNYYKYYGCSQGKSRQQVKTSIEKLDLKTLTVREAVFHVLKALIGSHDEGTEKKFEFELSWVCAASNNEHAFVPQDIIDAEVKRAEEELEKEDFE